MREILEQIRRDTDIWRSEIHGISHWERVEENGLMLSEVVGADKRVVSYFAYLHDCQRWNEDDDPEHGPRAAIYAKKNRDLIDLDDDQFRKLTKACEGHTFAMPSDYPLVDPTLATCWDADRLDIGRVGLDINSDYLFTEYAKQFSDF